MVHSSKQDGGHRNEADEKIEHGDEEGGKGVTELFFRKNHITHPGEVGKQNQKISPQRTGRTWAYHDNYGADKGDNKADFFAGGDMVSEPKSAGDSY